MYVSDILKEWNLEIVLEVAMPVGAGRSLTALAIASGFRAYRYEIVG